MSQNLLFSLPPRWDLERHHSYNAYVRASKAREITLFNSLLFSFFPFSIVFVSSSSPARECEQRQRAHLRRLLTFWQGTKCRVRLSVWSWAATLASFGQSHPKRSSFPTGKHETEQNAICPCRTSLTTSQAKNTKLLRTFHSKNFFKIYW